jgi:hypothetical protein
MNDARIGRIAVPLWQLAHGRSGDKGNRSNIGLITWEPAFYPVLVDQLSEARVAACFAHRRPSRVVRYLLPKLQAINFVLDELLDGGVNDALNLDGHGKALSFLLLDLPIELPEALVPLLRSAALHRPSTDHRQPHEEYHR